MSDAKLTITTPELKRMIKHPPKGFCLLDVRERSEYEDSHIAGCKLIPLGELMQRARELNPQDDIVIYCAHGVRSMQALMGLKSLGFTKLRSLEGGICEFHEHLD